MSEQTPQFQGMSAEEYQTGSATGEFLRQATEAEKQINDMANSVAHLDEDEQGVSVRRADNLSNRYHSGKWPRERAASITRELSRVRGSGLDIDAMLAVDKLRDKADRINEAHDTVLSGGAEAQRPYDEKRINSKLSGDNQIGPSSFGMHESSQESGAMVTGSGRKYDIKDGVAMRSGGPDGSKYKPFASQHQERAEKAMKSLAEKRMKNSNEQARQDTVKAAKEILGRAGVKIPKEKKVEPNGQEEIAA